MIEIEETVPLSEELLEDSCNRDILNDIGNRFLRKDYEECVPKHLGNPK